MILKYTKEDLDLIQLNEEFKNHETLSLKFGGLHYQEGNLCVMFNRDLVDSEKTLTNDIVNGHVPQTETEMDKTIERLAQKIDRARVYGAQLMNEFAAENVIMGLSNDQIMYLAQALSPVISIIGTGSLKLAKGLWLQMDPIPVILEQDRIDKYTAKLDNILKKL